MLVVGSKLVKFKRLVLVERKMCFFWKSTEMTLAMNFSLAWTPSAWS